MEIAEDLLPFLNPWLTETDEPRLMVDITGRRPSAEQLIRAVNSGLPIDLDNTKTGGEFSLNYLEPVIERIQVLRITVTNTVLTNIEILEHASRLTSFEWLYPSFRGSVDFSELPRLRNFAALFTPELATVMANRNIKELGILGSELSHLPLIEAPLEALLITDRRATDRLPELAHPESLRSFRVDMPRRFDAASLLAASNLEKVQLNGVGRLENVAALTKLTKLARLEVEAASVEDWDALLESRAPSALFILSPNPSKKLRDEGARRGWVVAGKHDQRSGQLMPFDLLNPWEEGGGPVLHLDDFAAVAEMIAATVGAEALDEEGVNGHLVEDLLRAACEADQELSGAVIEFDSEAGGMYAAFPTRKLAQRAVRATLALLRDPDKLRAVLANAG